MTTIQNSMISGSSVRGRGNPRVQWSVLFSQEATCSSEIPLAWMWRNNEVRSNVHLFTTLLRPKADGVFL
jgi:hypothetical protein